MAPTAPCTDVSQNPSAYAVSAASRRTVRQRTGCGARNPRMRPRRGDALASAVPVAAVVVSGREVGVSVVDMVVSPVVGSGARPHCRGAGTGPLPVGVASLVAQRGLTGGQLIDQPNIMAWSSCARLWQWAT